MSVVIWDGTTLAADKRATNAGTTYRTTKIFRQGDTLVGITGHFGHGHAVLAWLARGRDPTTYPEAEPADRCYCLVVHRDGRLERFEGSPYPLVVEERVHALGSARDFALMAVHLGYDARRAVELTCELSVDCGDGMDVLRFVDD
jgi:hypothetical protein